MIKGLINYAWNIDPLLERFPAGPVDLISLKCLFFFWGLIMCLSSISLPRFLPACSHLHPPKYGPCHFVWYLWITWWVAFVYAWRCGERGGDDGCYCVFVFIPFCCLHVWVLVCIHIIIWMKMCYQRASASGVLRLRYNLPDLCFHIYKWDTNDLNM